MAMLGRVDMGTSVGRGRVLPTSHISCTVSLHHISPARTDGDGGVSIRAGLTVRIKSSIEPSISTWTINSAQISIVRLLQIARKRIGNRRRRTDKLSQHH